MTADRFVGRIRGEARDRALGVKRELTPLENLAVARALSAAEGGVAPRGD